MPTSPRLVTGAIIVNDQNQVWVQRRAKNRSLFPGGWDLAGGHAEPGETPQESLKREIFEETGWQLQEIKTLIHTLEWSPQLPTDNHVRREYDFLVTVSGDLTAPILETQKVDAHIWLSHSDLDLLKENRPSTDTYIHSVVSKAFQVLTQLNQSSLPYTVSGKVTHGEKVGRTIGFPTANLAVTLSENQLTPGVYAGFCHIGSSSKKYPALIYFGPRLVFGEQKNNFELFLLNFNQDLYGQTLTTSVEYFIRKPSQFTSLENLKQGLTADLIEAKLYFEYLQTFETA